DLGIGFFNLGNLDLVDGSGYAEDHFKSAASVFESLTADDPADLDHQKRLAFSYRRLGDVLRVAKPDEARNWYGKALDRVGPLAQENRRVVDYSIEWAGVFMNLSRLESSAGDKAAATAALEQSRDILIPLAARFPTVARCQIDLAVTYRELASIQ